MRKLKDEQFDLVKGMYVEGKSAKAIGEYFGCSSTTVVCFLRKRGVVLRKKGRVSKLNHEKVADAIALVKGRNVVKPTYSDIAKELGVSVQTVSKFMKASGIQSV